MSSPLTSFTTIKFVNDGDADPSVTALAGQTFHFPPEYLTVLGSSPSNPGVIWLRPPSDPSPLPVRGYLRTEVDGSHSWVMTSEVTAAQKTAILAIPGGLGWVDQTLTTGTPLRITHGVGKALVQAGISGASVLDVLTKLVRAGASNRDAQIAAGG